MITNTILFFYSISRLFSTNFEFNKILFILLVFGIGIAITIYAVSKAGSAMAVAVCVRSTFQTEKMLERATNLQIEHSPAIAYEPMLATVIIFLLSS